MSAMDHEARGPRGCGAMAVMALAGMVFVGSMVIKPSQDGAPTDPVAAAVEPVMAAAQTASPETAPAEMAAAAVDGAAAAGEEASPIDWAMIGSAATFVFTGLGAIAGVVFGWRNDRRKERLAELRARELELEIARLRAVGGV